MMKWILTLPSEDGDTGIEFNGLLASSSDAHSAHINCSSFFASSIVIPMQLGWNLHDLQKHMEDKPLWHVYKL